MTKRTSQGAGAIPTPDPIAGGDSRDIPELSPALPTDLARALGWLRTHLSEPIQLEQLAQVSGVRPRTLESHFKMFLGTTPLGWVRRMRLARARQELIRLGPRASVTDAASASLPVADTNRLFNIVVCPPSLERFVWTAGVPTWDASATAVNTG